MGACGLGMWMGLAPFAVAQTQSEVVEPDVATPMEAPAAAVEEPAPMQAPEDMKQKQLQARVLGVDDKDLVLQIENVAVPMRVSHDTSINGETTARTRRIEARLKREFAPGQMVNVTYSMDELRNAAVSIEKQTNAPNAEGSMTPQ